MHPLPVLLCIDVEPDEFFIEHDRTEPWRGYEAAVEWAGQVRGGLSGEGGPARFTWVLRMDHQVAEVYGHADWVVRHYPGLLASLVDAGDDIGLHAHAYRWDPTERAWIVDHGNQAWVEECLETSFGAFAQAFGRPCTTFRAGDRWMNHATMVWLERHGVRFDLTVEPGHPALPSYHPGERFTGSLPDYTYVPVHPYHPDGEDFRREDRGGASPLWVIPMTTAAVQARWIRRVYYRLFRPWRTGVWTAMLSNEPVLFDRIISAALHDPATVHLALPVRSDVFASPRLMQRVRQNIETLRRHARTRPFVWTTAEGVVERLGLRQRG